MVSWPGGWEMDVLRALLSVAGLLIVGLFVINRAHAWQGERIRQLEDELERTVLGWAWDDIIPDETLRLSRLRGSDRDVLVRVSLRLMPGLAEQEVNRVRSALRRWGLLDRELAGLRHWSSARRADACRILGRLGYVPAIPGLIERLRDPDAMVRERAITALGELRALEALQPIADALDATAGWTDMLAIIALSRMGPDSVPRVGALLRESKSPAMTKGLLQVTAQLGRAEDPEFVRALASHADPEVRVEAVRALGRIPAEAASVDVCLAAMDDAAWPTRALAARSLGNLADPRAIPRLERAMGDRAYWVRHHAGQALAKLGQPGQGALQRRLADPNPFVRDMATQMLALAGASE